MDMDFPRLDSLEAWENHQQKTVKLDVLGKIVRYHLEMDGRSSLTMDEDGQTVVPKKTQLADDTQYTECDRIVIFSAFPSSNKTIMSVSTMFGLFMRAFFESAASSDSQAA